MRHTCIGPPSIQIFKLHLAGFWHLCCKNTEVSFLIPWKGFEVFCFMLSLIPFCLHFISNDVNAVVVLCTAWVHCKKLSAVNNWHLRYGSWVNMYCQKHQETKRCLRTSKLLLSSPWRGVYWILDGCFSPHWGQKGSCWISWILPSPWKTSPKHVRMMFAANITGK